MARDVLKILEILGELAGNIQNSDFKNAIEKIVPVKVFVIT